MTVVHFGNSERKAVDRYMGSIARRNVIPSSSSTSERLKVMTVVHFQHSERIRSIQYIYIYIYYTILFCTILYYTITILILYKGGEEYQGEGEREGGGGGVEVYRENKNPTVGMWGTICFNIAYSK